tara:strand:- start:1306 stop:1740 length:435 start_codon:yes stop_codon:yes gene_type:complete
MRVMAVGVFDLLHAGHLHYLEQARALGNHLTVVVAHDDTVRARKHEPVTNHDLRKRMVEGLKPVDAAIIGNSPDVSIFEILPKVNPDIIALGYDQEHAEDSIKQKLQELGHGQINVTRVDGLSDDLDGTRKIIARILELSRDKK